MTIRDIVITYPVYLEKVLPDDCSLGSFATAIGNLDWFTEMNDALVTNIENQARGERSRGVIGSYVHDLMGAYHRYENEEAPSFRRTVSGAMEWVSRENHAIQNSDPTIIPYFGKGVTAMNQLIGVLKASHEKAFLSATEAYALKERLETRLEHDRETVE
jgi:hypothetical protein